MKDQIFEMYTVPHNLLKDRSQDAWEDAYSSILSDSYIDHLFYRKGVCK